MSAWDAIAQVWEDTKTGWAYAAREAEATYREVIEADPEIARPAAASFIDQTIARGREVLAELHAALPRPAVTEAERAQVARYEALAASYNELVAPFMADVEPVPAEGATGILPLLVYGGLALGSLALAYVYEPTVQQAASAWQAGAEAELQRSRTVQYQSEAAVEASKEGRALELPAVPAEAGPPNPFKAASRLGVVLVGGAAALAAVFYFTRVR